MTPIASQQATQEDRFGLKLAAHLSASSSALPPDLSARLKAARMQAIAQRKVSVAYAAAQQVGSGPMATLAWGTAPNHKPNWWLRLGSLLPLLALLIGLVFIANMQEDQHVRDVAEIDAALLLDELPPAAFADPGFVQFLKASR